MPRALRQAEHLARLLDIDRELVMVIGAWDGHAVDTRAHFGAHDLVAGGDLSVAEVDVGSGFVRVVGGRHTSTVGPRRGAAHADSAAVEGGPAKIAVTDGRPAAILCS
jgi:hypothetical protein